MNKLFFDNLGYSARNGEYENIEDRTLSRSQRALPVSFPHWILPSTPANQRSEQRIIVESIILGAVLIWIDIKSITQPSRYFTLGLILFLAVYAINALSDASPVDEGLVVKVSFALFYILGIVSVSLTGDPKAA